MKGAGFDFSFRAANEGTFRLEQYQFNVNGQSDTGTLSWNANSTLQQLAINDALPNSTDSQTCNYTHDDLTRIASANCGTAANQTFIYDPFGNISKSGSPYSFQPTYNTATNRIAMTGYTYDANGNVLADPAHSYAWDADGNSVTVDTAGITYDALDRAVEQNRSGAYAQMVYTPGGAKLAIMSGQTTLQKAFIPLPGQATAIYTSAGLDHYRHSDWLGNARVTSTPSRGVVSTVAYAPFGETYAQSGTADPSFTGMNQDTTSGDYDFPAREYNSVQGRWASPDPAGMGAVNPMAPQSWNRYAYVLNNPLSQIDPLGLDCIFMEDGEVQVVSGDCATDGPQANGIFVDSVDGTTTAWLDANGNLHYAFDYINSNGQAVLFSSYQVNDFTSWDWSSGNGFTFQLGLAVNWNFWGPVAVSGFAGIAIDSHGHVATYSGAGGGLAAGAGVSGGLQLAGSNGNSVCALGGPFMNVSGTGGYVLAGTGDYFTGAGNAPGGVVQGGGVTLGVGGGGAGSVQVTGTKVHPFGHTCVNGQIQ